MEAVTNKDMTKAVRFFELAVKLSAISAAVYHEITKDAIATVLEGFFNYDPLT